MLGRAPSGAWHIAGTLHGTWLLLLALAWAHTVLPMLGPNSHETALKGLTSGMSSSYGENRTLDKGQTMALP